jgi:hypothetical protein
VQVNLDLESDQVSFGDVRIDNRCKHLLRSMYACPDKSFPKMTDSWGALKACYRFLNNEKVTRDKILAAHLQQTVHRSINRKAILAVQDTTTLSYPTHRSTVGLGHVGTRDSGLGYGMLVHSTFAIDIDSHEPLGILHQEVMVRDSVHPKEETYKERLTRPRESDKWINGVKMVKELLPLHSRIIHVADREADIYFLMKEIVDADHFFVIRQTRDRKTDDGTMTASLTMAQEKGSMSIDVPRNGTRKARRAIVSLRSCSVVVHPPRVINRVGTALKVNVVVVTESMPPPGGAPLSWVLLTNEPVDSLEECIRIVQHYQARWGIEEFHKALKTGCSIEQRQVNTRGRLENVLGLSTIIAMVLLHLKYEARINEQAPTETITPTQLTILRKKFPHLSENASNKQVLHHIARLGGFLGRKSDGNPGWIVLMRGYYDLLLIEQGYLMALLLVGKG